MLNAIIQKRKGLTGIAKVKFSAILDINSFTIKVITGINKTIFFKQEY